MLEIEDQVVLTNMYEYMLYCNLQLFVVGFKQNWK